MNVSAQNVCPVPTIKSLCSGVPKLENTLEVAHHYGLGREIEQVGSLAQLLLALSQFRRSFEHTLFQVAVQQLQLCCLSVQLGEHTHLGAQEFGDYGNGDIIHRPSLISLEPVQVGQVYGRDEDNRDFLKPWMLPDHVRKLKPIQFRHAHIHQADRDVRFQQD